MEKSDGGREEGTREKKELETHASRVSSNSLCESLRTLVDDDVPPSGETRLTGIDDLGRIVLLHELGDDGLLGESRRSRLSEDGGSVDGDVSEVGEELLSSVLGGDELEEIGSIVDELLRRRRGIRASSTRGSWEEEEMDGRRTVVQVCPETKTSWVRSRKRKGMLVFERERGTGQRELRRREEGSSSP